MNVFWTRGQKQQGITVHDGIIVVRPHWVAFLPTKAPVNLAAGIALAVAGATRLGDHETVFPVERWWQHGAHTFDQLVTENARAQGGFVLTSADAELVMNGGAAQVRFRPSHSPAAEPALLVFLGARAPLEMFAGWRRVAGVFDARGLAKVFAVVTAFPFAFGCLGAYIALTSDDYSTLEKVLGVAFWWGLVALAWVVYVVLYVRHRRPARS